MVIWIMRLFGKEWAAVNSLSLDGGDPFDNMAGTTLACKLIAKPAFVRDVGNAMKAGTTMTKGGMRQRSDFVDVLV